ncbi:MAG: VanZ family protein [Saprospiraceae bacterium]
MTSKLFSFLLYLPSKIWLWFSIVWTILLLTLSLISVRQAARFSIDVIGFDKLGHFVFYTVLTLSWLMTFKEKKQIRYVIIGSIISFGILIEILQLKMGVGRAFEYFDMLANIIGTLCGIVIFYNLNKYRNIAD